MTDSQRPAAVVGSKKEALKGAVRSKTMWFALALEVLGVIQLEIPKVAEQLGPYYGWVLIAIGVSLKVLRAYTTKPLPELGKGK
jgi:hypothetical protein